MHGLVMNPMSDTVMEEYLVVLSYPHQFWADRTVTFYDYTAAEEYAQKHAVGELGHGDYTTASIYTLTSKIN